MKRGGINLRDRFTVGPDSWGIFSCSSFMCLAQLKQPRGILFKTSTTRYPINHKLLPSSAGVQEMESFRCGMGGRPLSTNKGNGIINVGRSANSPPRYLIASCDTHGVAPRGASSQSVRPSKIKLFFFFGGEIPFPRVPTQWAAAFFPAQVLSSLWACPSPSPPRTRCRGRELKRKEACEGDAVKWRQRDGSNGRMGQPGDRRRFFRGLIFYFRAL